MTQENKDLLLKDLCARLPYFELMVQHKGEDFNIIDIGFGRVTLVKPFMSFTSGSPLIEEIKPYLRPMSSMTEEEREELLNLLFDKEAKYFYIDEEGFIDGKTSYLMKDGLNYPSFCPINIVLYTDWLNENKFDYRGLIPLGLALEAPKNMYNYG